MNRSRWLWGCLVVSGLSGTCPAQDVVLRVATLDHPHIRAILDGRVKAPVCSLQLTTATADALSQDLNGPQHYDLMEVDIVPFLKRRSAGEYTNYVLIPVFLTRGFQMRNIYIRTDRAIHSPSDLRGKTVGVSERSLSASVWVRGVLHSSWTVKPGDMIVKELPDAGAALRLGQLDAAFTTVEPVDLNVTTTRITRLFNNYYEVESELFKQNRVFPIGSALAIRKSIVDQNPWLPEAIFLAFSEAKKKAMIDATLPMPWSGAKREETEKLMGKNFWSYGVKSNPKTLGALFRYLTEQGRLQKPIRIEDVFASSTLMLIEN